MKCPQCPQFTSKDTDAEPEANFEIDEDGTVSGDVRIANLCADCSTELEEANFTVEIDLTSEVAEHKAAYHPKKSMDLDVDADVGRTDETKRTDRRGKPIKNPRYWRRYYGIQVNATVRCVTCSEDIASGTFEDSIQASGMEWIA